MVKTTPNGHFFLNVGVWGASAGGVYGIISLTYYGLGFSHQPSAWLNIKNRTWPIAVRLNIQWTYMYLFFSFYICIVTAFFVFSHPILLDIFSSIAFMIVDVIVETLVQRGKLFADLSSRGIFSIQRIAWVSYCAFIGALSSTYLLNGIEATQKSIRLSFTITGALTLLSINAPVKKYYNWMKIGHVAQDIVSFASVGAAFIPLKYTIGAFFFSLSLYGGLLVFPLNFLSHSQEAHVKASEASATQPYCPPAMSIPLLLSTMSFFTRVLLLYATPKR